MVSARKAPAPQPTTFDGARCIGMRGFRDKLNGRSKDFIYARIRAGQLPSPVMPGLWFEPAVDAALARPQRQAEATRGASRPARRKRDIHTGAAP